MAPKDTTVANFIAAAAFLLALIMGILHYSSKEPVPPEFSLVNGPSFHPDSTIIAFAKNESAEHNDPLLVEFHGILYEGTIATQGEGYSWDIRIPYENLPEELSTDGIYNIRLGFSLNNMSNQRRIILDSRPPEASVTIISDSLNRKTIKGHIQDNGELSRQNMTVEATFTYPEINKEELPLKMYRHDGKTVYEFEYVLSEIPEISESNPAYREQFFALVIRDQAGNEVRHGATYEKFISRGGLMFGTAVTDVFVRTTDLEPITFEEEGDSLQNNELEPPDRITMAGGSYLKLRIKIQTAEEITLKWDELPEDLKPTGEYLIVRDGEEIGTALNTTEYTETVADDSTAAYLVLAKTEDGRYYESDSVVPVTKQLPRPMWWISLIYMLGVPGLVFVFGTMLMKDGFGDMGDAVGMASLFAALGLINGTSIIILLFAVLIFTLAIQVRTEASGIIIAISMFCLAIISVFRMYYLYQDFQVVGWSSLLNSMFWSVSGLFPPDFYWLY